MLIKKKHIIPFLACICVIALLVVGPIPQDPLYHQFADQRTYFRIPNFLNVITNLPFGVIGMLGIMMLNSRYGVNLYESKLTTCIALLFLMIGSSYYHLFPNNTTLIFDRIPISIIAISFLTFIIHIAANKEYSARTFIILNTIAVSSVIYWALTESYGKGDLRWYGLMQFFPIIAIPLILYLYKPAFNPTKEVTFIILFFALGKMMEKYDKEIYQLLANTVSGHSLKHLFMSVAVYLIVRLMVSNKKPKLLDV